jgi:hypothetical protein
MMKAKMMAGGGMMKKGYAAGGAMPKSTQEKDPSDGLAKVFSRISAGRTSNARDSMANKSRAASKAGMQRRKQEEMLNNRDFPPDLAAGGMAKAKMAAGGGVKAKMTSGGGVQRADGMAKKGKTKGKMV